MENKKKNYKWDIDVPGFNRGKAVLSALVVLIVVGCICAVAHSMRMPTVYRSYSRGHIVEVVLADGTVVTGQEEMKLYLKGTYDNVYVR